jgi:hypothetical protein
MKINARNDRNKSGDHHYQENNAQNQDDQRDFALLLTSIEQFLNIKI